MKTTYIVVWKCFMSLRPGQWAGQQHQYLINQELLIHSSHMTLGNVMHQRETRDHCTSIWYDPVSEDLNLVLNSMCLSLASEKVTSLSMYVYMLCMSPNSVSDPPPNKTKAKGCCRQQDLLHTLVLLLRGSSSRSRSSSSCCCCSGKSLTFSNTTASTNS